MLKKFKAGVLPFIAVCLAAAFPALFLYFTNAAEDAFTEIAEPLLAFLAAGIVLFFALFTIHSFR